MPRRSDPVPAWTPTARPAAGPHRGCHVRELMELLGRPYVLDLLALYHATPAPKRFHELQRQLGISPNTLTERLKQLVGAGFLTRTTYREIPPRVDYAPTAKLAGLAPLFDNLAEWASEFDLRPSAGVPAAP